MTASDEPSQGGLGAPARRTLGLIVLVASALRFYGIGARPRLWEDEIGMLKYALAGDPTGIPHEAPLYSWLQFVWMAWTQQPTANTMRLLSIGFGVLGVVCAFWLGRKIGGVGVGLLTAALLAINPMSLYLAHEVRPYSLYIAASLLLIGTCMAAWDRDRAREWSLYAAAMILTVMSHLLVSQLCIALALTALAASWLERDRAGWPGRLLRFFVVSGVSGLVGLSWLAFREDPPLWDVGPHTRGLLDFLYRCMLSLGGGDPKHAWLPAIVCGLALWGVVVVWRRRRDHAILLVLILFVSGTVTYRTMSPVSSAFWLGWQRYLAHMLVPFLILVAAGSVDLANRVAGARVWLRGVVLLIPLCLVIPGSLTWLKNPNRHVGVANIEAYARFMAKQAHAVEGVLLFEGVHQGENWLSPGGVRRRYAIQFERVDDLPTFGISRLGVYAVGSTMSRGEIMPIPIARTMAKPPKNGRYVVFPPTIGCAGLRKPSSRGVIESRAVRQFRWGLICDISFAKDAHETRLERVAR